jgi:hypothetical protein
MSAAALGEALELARAASERQADLAALGIQLSTAEAVNQVRAQASMHAHGGGVDPAALAQDAQAYAARMAALGIAVTAAEAVCRGTGKNVAVRSSAAGENEPFGGG